jgi:hypothetical protein
MGNIQRRIFLRQVTAFKSPGMERFNQGVQAVLFDGRTGCIAR